MTKPDSGVQAHNVKLSSLIFLETKLHCTESLWRSVICSKRATSLKNVAKFVLFQPGMTSSRYTKQSAYLLTLPFKRSVRPLSRRNHELVILWTAPCTMCYPSCVDLPFPWGLSESVIHYYDTSIPDKGVKISPTVREETIRLAFCILQLYDGPSVGNTPFFSVKVVCPDALELQSQFHGGL